MQTTLEIFKYQNVFLHITHLCREIESINAINIASFNFTIPITQIFVGFDGSFWCSFPPTLFKIKQNRNKNYKARLNTFPWKKKIKSREPSSISLLKLENAALVVELKNIILLF